MAGQYQVVRELGSFTANTVTGRMKVTVYAPGMVPDGATDAEIRHHLAMGLIRPVGAAPQQEPQPAREPASTATAQVEVLSEERQAARAKLPEDGSLPHPNAGKPVWVEAAVDRGYSFEAANAVEKAELVALLKQG